MTSTDDTHVQKDTGSGAYNTIKAFYNGYVKKFVKKDQSRETMTVGQFFASFVLFSLGLHTLQTKPIDFFLILETETGAESTKVIRFDP